MLKRYIPFVLVFILFFSCSEKNDSTAFQIDQLLRSATWRIADYSEDGTDQTSQFSGGTMSFISGSEVQTRINGGVENGIWTLSIDPADPNQNTVNIAFFFNSGSTFSKINRDWTVVSYSNTRIDMIYNRPSDQAVFDLVLQKN
ncbi:hypothetical protein SAMN04488519_11375 [Algoriphagus ornithinivorans]|uniref:Lipocalin-like domain-containing protein n=1 Tax=Algoriphagus ornithinivorans TaxID=226506 RepID=A0A1I5JRU4_9BACT|nr:hypothetical protein [Algoriphagus ornithinivorans]SFO75532.1 hypothetical protein SAMN04488519_11375 [Algoriphagus ornithinivorans]